LSELSFFSLVLSSWICPWVYYNMPSIMVFLFVFVYPFNSEGGDGLTLTVSILIPCMPHFFNTFSFG
jgi:hypothetical protein